MCRYLPFFCAFGFGLAPLTEAKFPEDFSQPLKTIVFGSCNKHALPQPLWSVMADEQPDLYLWLGDNIYGDSADPAVLKAKYDAQFAQPEYAAFRERTPILGTWDDHDYGENNGGSSFPAKAESATLALDFMEVPAGDPRRAHEGIFGDYTFGPEGKRVAIFLIDDRYFADKPGAGASLLGEAQWQWLESALLASDAQVNLIASGIQILNTAQPYEKWGNFPQDRQRLLGFIRKHGIPGVVLISGDRHIHEIAVKRDHETAYPLIELTSSGLTHTWRDFPGEANPLRWGDVYRELGFGLIELDWDGSRFGDGQPAIKLAIVNAEGEVVNAITLPINTLKAVN